MVKICRRCSWCSSGVRLAMMMSSKYQNMEGRCLNRLSMKRCKVYAALQRQKGMKRYLNKPNGVMIAVLATSWAAIGI
jgi:hypothetical protein